MRQWGIRVILVLACLILATRSVDAQSSLLSLNFDQSAGDGNLQLHTEEPGLSEIRQGTIFDSKTLNFSGDVSNDGASFNFTYKFGKNFMTFDGSFGGPTTSFDTGLSSNGIGGSARLSYRDSATLSYRIGRFVAPNVAVYGMVGTSKSQLGTSISASGITTFTDVEQVPVGVNEIVTPAKYIYRTIVDSNSCRREKVKEVKVLKTPASVSYKTIYANVENTVETAFSGSSERDSGVAGAVIGAGLEMLLADSVHVRAEYRYIDYGSLQQAVSFGSESANLLPVDTPSAALFDLDSSFHSAYVSVFYKF